MRWTRCCATSDKRVNPRKVFLYFLLLVLLAGCDGPAAPATPLPAGLHTPTPSVIQDSGTLSRAISENPDIFNPILSTNRAGADVNNVIFPVLVGRNPFTGQDSANNAMAERWEVSADGLTYTFALRPNVTWSDGDPVDAADFKFTYDAMASQQVDSPHKAVLENVAGIVVVDPLTVRVTFKQARCDTLAALRIGWLPSHLYEADFTDIMENLLNSNPSVSAGPFIFQSWAPGENVAMRRNETYWQGAPSVERLFFQIVPDPADRLARLLAGDLDTTSLAADQLTSVQGSPNLTVYGANIDGYDFIALNLANPENPQPGLDAAGNRVAQEPHPILGDLTVRQAIVRAIDYKTIIESIYLNRGYQIASNVLPVAPWAHDATIEPYTYDPIAARKLLEEASWLDSNSDGIREKETESLSLTLLVTEGNKVYEQIADLAQDQLNSVGFDITVTPVSSGVLVERLLGQRYDMAVTGWTGVGADPNDDVFWATQHDRPGSGFNFVSYQNAEVDRLLQQGVTAPGCKPEDRAPIYKQIQRIIHDDLPYIFISGEVTDIGYNNRWAGIQPAGWDFYWNIHQWYNSATQP